MMRNTMTSATVMAVAEWHGCFYLFSVSAFYLYSPLSQLIPMPHLARNLAAVGVLGTAGWWLNDAYRLSKTYPIRGPKACHCTPGIQHAQPADVGEVEVVYARVQPPQPLARPIDAYEKAFFSNWILQLEGAVFHKLGLLTPRPANADAVDTTHPTEYLGGFFPVVHRDPHALLVGFRMTSEGNKPAPGGTQLITAVEADDGQPGELELSYANYALAPPAPQEPAFIVPFHRWFMRYLIDRAKTRMEREWK